MAKKPKVITAPHGAARRRTLCLRLQRSRPAQHALRLRGRHGASVGASGPLQSSACPSQPPVRSGEQRALAVAPMWDLISRPCGTSLPPMSNLIPALVGTLSLPCGTSLPPLSVPRWARSELRLHPSLHSPCCRIYIPAIYVCNKIDQITLEELQLLDRMPHYCPVSAHAEWNLDGLLEMARRS